MPIEVWSGHKPSLRHLRVFGCEAYAHVLKEKWTKLDKKAIKCIFIGYSYGVKGYKLWNPVEQKVCYSRSVIFRETKPSSVIVQLEQTKQKEDVIQLPATLEKVESRPLERQEVEESSMSSESSKEEEVPKAEPKPDLARRSTRQRKPPERYGYSPDDWRCIFALNANIDEPRSIEEALGMNDSESWKIAMDEEMLLLRGMKHGTLYHCLKDESLLVVNECSRRRWVQMEALRSIKHVWLQKVTLRLRE